MASVWKRLQRVGKHASKFQFVASYQELMVESTKKWQPDKLVVVWTTQEPTEILQGSQLAARHQEPLPRSGGVACTRKRRNHCHTLQGPPRRGV
ncbi:uncharacterized protein [Salmo salar]|uniref:Uncharacterized protein n=1 Tax=Salmo salar TaxID=8030 RepID=A0ABM3EC72_SALSA|nr:uncharacterized protein LOC106592239 [Salmo salar]